MKVYVYIDEADRPAFDMVTNKIKETNKEFDWTAYSSKDTTAEKWNSLLACYRIDASSSEDLTANLKWEPFSKAVKDASKKEKLWKDIQQHVIPMMASKSTVELILSSEQIQKILSMITNANSSFKLDLVNGKTISVSPLSSDNELSFSHADIASMLAAIFIFKAKAVNIGD